MKTFTSLYLNNDLVPDDILIYDGLNFVGYTGYIPKTFIADLLVLSKIKLLKLNILIPDNNYINSVQEIVKLVKVNSWVYDIMLFLKRMSKQYDLRIIETYARKGIAIQTATVGFSFNYKFDIKDIDISVQKLLNISENQLQEIDALSDDIIDILTISNGLGSFLKTTRQITTTNKTMSSYGDIVKVNKRILADPLFKYKFSIKAYDTPKESFITNQSDKIVVGYFLGNYKRQNVVNILLKLLGTILLNNYTEGIKIIIYSFYADTYLKKELTTEREIIDYFSSPKQLKLFAINNTKSLETMVIENPGNDVVFLPNVLGDCQVRTGISDTNRINIISVKESEYNLQYANVCKKTGGTFLTI